MKNKHIIALLVLLAGIMPTANGQALKSSYFMENSLYRNRMNPAFTPRANYFSIPVIGTTGVGLYSNMGISDFLYPKNGELYSYLNENVTLKEFSRNLAKKPYIDMEFDTDLFSFGFYSGKNSFWNFNLGLKVDAQIDIPRDLFLMTKQGMSSSSQEYYLDRFNIYQTSAIQASLGYSRNLSDLVPGLNVGMKFKFLLGVEHIGMRLDEARIYMSQDKWMVDAKANGNIAASFLDVTLPSENTDFGYNTDLSSIAPAGLGFAFDFGAEYVMNIGCLLDGLTLSASITDLGGMFYNTEYLQSFQSAGSAEFSGFTGMTFEDYDFQANLEEIMDEFMNIANFEQITPDGKLKVSTGPRIYLGAEMPFLKNLMSVGLLYSNKIAYRRVSNELTLAYNLTPSKWFNLGVNYSFLNIARSIGWMIEFSPRGGVDFYIGSDYTYLEFTPQFLPVDRFCINARFGATFMLGSKYGR